MRILGENDRLPMGSTVATIGMFDGVHLGHATLVDFLKQRATQAGKQSLVITFKHHPRKVLHPAEPFSLIMSLDDRLACLEELGPDLLLALDFTPELAALDSAQFIEFLRDRYGVETLVAGYNHRFGHQRGETFMDYCRHGQQLGVTVVKAPEYLGQYAPVSSTIVRGLIAAGRVVDAMHCMGRPYRLTGKVIHGFHNGKGLGFPTANIAPESVNTMLPAAGVYEILCEVADPSIPSQPLRGMLNIGTLPTFQRHQLSVEAHLFNFSGDLYGKTLTLSLLRRLRSERRFTSVEALARQLSADKASILSHEAE